MTRASLKATLAYFIAAATFLTVAEIEGIHDNRATQVCIFFGAQLLTMLLIADDEDTWTSVLISTLAGGLMLVCLSLSHHVVTPPYAWLIMSACTLAACAVARYTKPLS